MSFKLVSFLEKYDVVLFDMDGVITNEAMYWDAAALTVREFLKSNKYYGSGNINPEQYMKDVEEIRKKTFCDDRIIRLFKNRGVNSNWDLAYLVISVALLLDTEDDFEPVFEYWNKQEMDAFVMYEHAAQILEKELCLPKSYVTRLSTFWTDIELCFQEWLLGDKAFVKDWHTRNIQTGKSGLMYTEKPIIDEGKLNNLLAMLSKTHILGIGTGRPFTEATSALDSWGIRKYFNESRIINYNYIKNTEQMLRESGNDTVLTKPHPFMFLKAIFGDEVSDVDLINGNYDKSRCEKALVVGDAGADMYSAFAAGCDFAAVLTGIDGDEARSFFEKENATYILKDVLELMTDK